MAGGHVTFFVGLGAGVALLALPVLTLMPDVNVAARMGNWISGPPPEAPAPSTQVVAVTRPQRGFVPGAPTPAPDAPPPTLQAAIKPTPPPPAPPTPAPAAQPTLAGVRAGVVRSSTAPGGVPVRRVAGVESPGDPRLADGSPVLIGSGPDLDVRGQRWRAVRGLNGVAGWVLSSQVAVDVETSSTVVGAEPTPGASGEQVRVANTGGVGVALRNSPRDEDRLPSGLRDGTQVMVVERSGAEWVRVRSASGQEGWVPTRFLAPST